MSFYFFDDAVLSMILNCTKNYVIKKNKIKHPRETQEESMRNEYSWEQMRQKPVIKIEKQQLISYGHIISSMKEGNRLPKIVTEKGVEGTRRKEKPRKKTYKWKAEKHKQNSEEWQEAEQQIGRRTDALWTNWGSKRRRIEIFLL